MHECRQIEEQVPNLGSKDVNGKGNVEDEKVMILRAVAYLECKFMYMNHGFLVWHLSFHAFLVHLLCQNISEEFTPSFPDHDLQLQSFLKHKPFSGSPYSAASVEGARKKMAGCLGFPGRKGLSLLLLEEILHQLIGCPTKYTTGMIHPRGWSPNFWINMTHINQESGWDGRKQKFHVLLPLITPLFPSFEGS